jgi:hypothetical protein
MYAGRFLLLMSLSVCLASVSCLSGCGGKTDRESAGKTSGKEGNATFEKEGGNDVNYPPPIEAGACKDNMPD